MKPTQGVGQAAQPDTDDPKPTPTQLAAALVPIADVDPAALPQPHALGHWLGNRIEAGIATMRTQRGKVCQPEDTYALVRELTRTDDVLAEIVYAVNRQRDRIRGALEEELTEVNGEQSGIPNGALVVPVDGGEVRVAASWSNRYDVDTEQVASVMVAALADEWGDKAAADPEQFALAAVEQFANPDTGVLGKVTAKPTKVKAVAASLAARELDSLAAVARSAIGQPVRTFKGVTVERSTPKP